MNKKDKIAVYLTMFCCIPEVASTYKKKKKKKKRKERKKKEQKMKNEKEQVQCK